MYAKFPKCSRFEDCIHVLKIEKVESYCTPKCIILQHPSIFIHCSTLNVCWVELQLLKDPTPLTGVYHLRQQCLAWVSVGNSRAAALQLSSVSRQPGTPSQPRYRWQPWPKGAHRSVGRTNPTAHKRDLSWPREREVFVANGLPVSPYIFKEEWWITDMAQENQAENEGPSTWGLYLKCCIGKNCSRWVVRTIPWCFTIVMCAHKVASVSSSQSASLGSNPGSATSPHRELGQDTQLLCASASSSLSGGQ